MTMSNQVWSDFQSNKLLTALREADRLSIIQDDESTPYKSKYEAAEILKSCKETAEGALQSEGLSESAKAAFKTAVAVLEARWGLVLLETDLVSEAEAALESGIQVLSKQAFVHVTLLLESYNSLGLLWSTRGELAKAVDLLTKAEQLYLEWTAANEQRASKDSPELQNLSLESSSGQEAHPDGTAAAGSVQAGPSAQLLANAKDKYAHTLFYLAQVYGMQDETEKAALYCAGTLRYQLERGEFEQSHAEEWAQNCASLADFYISSAEFAVAEHLLNCAEAMRQRWGKGPSGEVTQLQADLSITAAKLYIKRLAVSAKRLSESVAPAQYLESLPERVRFEGLDVPREGDLPWGEKALMQNKAEATELFNAGMRKLRDALAFYVLDGWVTHHCNILLQISELYRQLAEFEDSGHKKCVLHKARAKRVEPLLHEINPAAFSSLYKTLQLEVASAYREIMEIKFDEDRPFEKVASAAAEARPYYEAYLKEFKKEGKLPEKVNSEEEELFVNSCFYMARILSRLDPPISSGNFTHTSHLREAVDMYRYCHSYIMRNNLESQKTLGTTCKEMADLIAENVEMMRVNAERQARTP